MSTRLTTRRSPPSPSGPLDELHPDVRRRGRGNGEEEVSRGELAALGGSPSKLWKFVSRTTARPASTQSPGRLPACDAPGRAAGSVTSTISAGSPRSRSVRAPDRSQKSHPPPSQTAQCRWRGSSTSMTAASSIQSCGTRTRWATSGPRGPSSSRPITRPRTWLIVQHTSVARYLDVSPGMTLDPLGPPRLWPFFPERA